MAGLTGSGLAKTIQKTPALVPSSPGARREGQGDTRRPAGGLHDFVPLASCLAATGDREQLLAVMAGEKSFETCCGGSGTVLLHGIVAVAQPQDGAWSIARLFDKPGGDGSVSIIDQALQKLTGHKMDQPKLSKPIATAAGFHKAYSEAWTRYLVAQRSETKPTASPTTAPATTHSTTAPATVPANGLRSGLLL